MTPSVPQMLEAIKEKIAAANPNLQRFTLEHVLKAIEKKSLSSNIDFDYMACVDQFRISYHEGVANTGKQFECFWTLTLPLSQQSEPTIKFLHQILCLPNNK